TPHPTPQPQPPKSRRGRIAVIAIAAALVFAIAGAGAAYYVLKDDGKETQNNASPKTGSSPEDNSPSQDNASPDATGSTGGGQGSEADTEQTPQADPEPAEYKSINLTEGYHLTLGDEDLRPQEGEDAGYELSYDSGGYLDAENDEGKLILLNPGQQGSLDVCRADTRFAQNIPLEKLTKGRQVCIITGTGHIGLLTYQGHSPEDSPSTYLTVDVTVWRNADS
ncbi:serine/threonine protein kinase, partial [Streptomyces sp. AC154]